MQPKPASIGSFSMIFDARPPRNLRRAGVDETVAMAISSAHKTALIFRRYNITDDRDLEQAVGRLESYLVQSVSEPYGFVFRDKKDT